ncbi:MAG: NAD(P)H-hydrate dehydratase [Bacteroidetes bacterium]|nr:NAD(P)H-hydrate dehydratase [Bacteroidota bacterium]
MLGILSADLIRAWDGFTIQEQQITSYDLMERAATAWTNRFIECYSAVTKNVVVVCGIGNNGGDGLVIARLLKSDHFKVRVVLVGNPEKGTNDFKLNLKQLPDEVEVLRFGAANPIDFFDSEVIVDALFGSGISRPLEGEHLAMVRMINQSQKHVVSVDIPSGLFPDHPTESPTVCASHTITFQAPKRSFFFPESMDLVGKLDVVSIGLSDKFQDLNRTHDFLLERNDISKIIRPRKSGSHKGNFGHVLLMAGSYGMTGAAVLSAKAALRSGSGKVTVHTAALGYSILQQSIPEAMVTADSDQHCISEVKNLSGFDAVGIGPGIGQSQKVVDALGRLIDECRIPLVIDADALNILSRQNSWLSRLPEHTILTPHPGEFRRLVGSWKDGEDRHRLLKKFSSESNCIVVLKGAHSAVASPDGSVYFNSTGNPYMATPGSGDVLLGVVASFLGQGMAPKEAAYGAVYIHGLAGDLASAGGRTILAGEIADDLSEAIKRIAQGLD